MGLKFSTSDQSFHQGWLIALNHHLVMLLQFYSKLLADLQQCKESLLLPSLHIHTSMRHFINLASSFSNVMILSCLSCFAGISASGDVASRDVITATVIILIIISTHFYMELALGNVFFPFAHCLSGQPQAKFCLKVLSH